jgi:histidine triad (HIT) family protein
MGIKQSLFKLARSRYAGYFIGFSFAHLTRLMPVDRRMDTPDVVVFRHPVPWWQTHLLGVPKKRLPSFMALDLTETETQNKILAVYAALQQTAVSYHITPFSILVNGGDYQDVPQIHFHLASGTTKTGAKWGLERWAAPGENTAVTHHHNAIAYPHPHSAYETHVVICAKTAAAPFIQFDLQDEQNQRTLLDFLRLTQLQVTSLNLPAFRLQINGSINHPEPLAMHLIR